MAPEPPPHPQAPATERSWLGFPRVQLQCWPIERKDGGLDGGKHSRQTINPIATCGLPPSLHFTEQEGKPWVGPPGADQGKGVRQVVYVAVILGKTSGWWGTANKVQGRAVGH